MRAPGSSVRGVSDSDPRSRGTGIQTRTRHLVGSHLIPPIRWLLTWMPDSGLPSPWNLQTTEFWKIPNLPYTKLAGVPSFAQIASSKKGKVCNNSAKTQGTTKTKKRLRVGLYVIKNQCPYSGVIIIQDTILSCKTKAKLTSFTCLCIMSSKNLMRPHPTPRKATPRKPTTNKTTLLLATMFLVY